VGHPAVHGEARPAPFRCICGCGRQQAGHAERGWRLRAAGQVGCRARLVISAEEGVDGDPGEIPGGSEFAIGGQGVILEQAPGKLGEGVLAVDAGERSLDG